MGTIPPEDPHQQSSSAPSEEEALLAIDIPVWVSKRWAGT